MSHEVESMAFVGEKPWHLFDTFLVSKEAESGVESEEFMAMAGLDWPVRLCPLEVKLNGSHQSTDMNAVVRDRAVKRWELEGSPVDRSILQNQQVFEALKATGNLIEVEGAIEHDILGYVGQRYRPLQNTEAFKAFDPLLELGCKWEAAGSLYNGKKVWAQVNFGDPMEVTKGDEINRFATLAHSHDGTLAITFGLTPIRAVCENTVSAALGHSKAKLLKFKHTANSKEALKAAGETLSIANQQFEATVEQYKLLAKASCSDKALRQYVRVLNGFDPNAKDEDIKTRAKNILNRIEELYASGKGQVPGTWWAAYNAITLYLSHEACRNAENRLASLWFGQNLVRNNKALSLALQMSGVNK